MTFPILTLTGAPYERGITHGRTFTSRVRRSIASYARMFAFYRGCDWAEMQNRATAFLPLLDDVAPHLLAEMRGIAAGAGAAFEEILALNVRTELLAGASFALRHPEFDAAMKRNRTAGVPQPPMGSNEAGGSNEAAGPSECTTLAAQPGATADGRTWLAQNWEVEQRDACVLLRVRQAGKPDLLTMTEAGIVGKIGLNSAGVGVCMNILASRLDGRAQGMPIHVLLRLMLECDGFDAAVARGVMAIPTGGLTSLARVELIRSLGATVLLATPSYALHLAEVAADAKIDTAGLGVRLVIVAGEPGGSVTATRGRIAAAWSADVLDHAGATEVGPWGVGDPRGDGLDVIEDWFHPEFLSLATGGPAEVGELAELVLTTLGRNGAPVCPHAIDEIVRGVPEVVEHQLTASTRESLDELSLAIEDRLDDPGRVARELQVRLGLRVAVTAVPIGSLPRFEGKGRRFIDHRNHSRGDA